MPDERAITISDHARRRLSQRGIGVKQIAQTLAQPDRTEADRDDPELRHAIRRFGRVFLRVVYNHRAQPPRIVTAFFDRRLRRKRP
jgi:hypothetical protein